MSEQKIYKFYSGEGMEVNGKYKVMYSTILNAEVSPVQLDFIPPLDWGNHSTYPFLQDFERLNSKVPDQLTQRGRFVNEIMSKKALQALTPILDSNTQIIPAIYDQKYHYYFVEPHYVYRTSSETAEERAAKTDGTIPYFQVWSEHVYDGCFINQSFFDLIKKHNLCGAIISPVWDLETNKEIY